MKVQEIIEKKSDQDSDDEFLASSIKSEKQSEEESNDEQLNDEQSNDESSLYNPKAFCSVSRKFVERSGQKIDKSMRYCDLCEYQTVNRRQMVRHCQGHSSERFDCKQCGAQFLSDSGLYRHTLRQHLQVDPKYLIYCQFCKRSFKNSVLFNIHITRNHKDET